MFIRSIVIITFFLYFPFIPSIFAAPPKLGYSAHKALYEAQTALDKGHFNKAYEILNTFITKNPDKSHYLIEFTLANTLVKTGKEKEAVKHYDKSIILYPDYGDTWNNLGKVLYDLKEYDRAGDCLLKGYELNDEKNPSLLYSSAVCHIIAGKNKKALPILERLISRHNDIIESRWLEALLQVSLKLNMTQRAVETAEKLIVTDTDSRKWWRVLTDIYLDKKEYKKGASALKLLSYSKELGKEEKIILGDLLNSLGIPKDAAQYYEEAFDSSPTLNQSRKMAQTYLAAHNTKSAINTLLRAVSKKEDSHTHFLLGQIYYRSENFVKALESFKKAVQLDTKRGEGYIMSGYCLYMLDRKKESMKFFRKALSFDMQKRDALDMLDHIEKDYAIN